MAASHARRGVTREAWLSVVAPRVAARGVCASQEKDSAGRSDEQLAAEAWSNYRARNDSAIVDHFQVRACLALCWDLRMLGHLGGTAACSYRAHQTPRSTTRRARARCAPRGRSALQAEGPCDSF